MKPGCRLSLNLLVCNFIYANSEVEEIYQNEYSCDINFSSSMDESILTMLKYETLIECIECLSDSHQKLFKHKYVDNIKQCDLAKILNVNLNTIKSRDRRIKSDIKVLFAEKMKKRLQPDYLDNYYNDYFNKFKANAAEI